MSLIAVSFKTVQGQLGFLLHFILNKPFISFLDLAGCCVKIWSAMDTNQSVAASMQKQVYRAF
jgi:hypothetical protein